MRVLLLGLISSCLVAGAVAQPVPLAADCLFVSNESLQKATQLEYRVGVGNASVHEHDAELFYVLEGFGTLITGGKLQDERRSDAANSSGSGIVGGNDQAVAKGDSFVVPETHRTGSARSTASWC